VIRTLAVEGYRSLRSLVLPLAPVTVVTGANGTGKSTLYRSLRLLTACARNEVVQALAREGGLPSALWAGPEVIGAAVRRGEYPVQGTVRKKPVSLRLGFAGDDLGYAIDLGLPQRPSSGAGSAFSLDPEIKREWVWTGPTLRPSTLMAERDRMLVKLRDDEGRWLEPVVGLATYDSLLSEFADPGNAPEMMLLRERLRSWRFYDHVRTDVDAPARRRQVGTFTPVLGADGADLAAAVQTILEIGDGAGLAAAVDRAFPGSSLHVEINAAVFELRLRQPGMLRALSTAELSDGTLRYLIWAAALLTPRPPQLMVLNEPETSLHPDLLVPLAELITRAARDTQLIVVTHARSLAASLADHGATHHELVSDVGETRVTGAFGDDGEPRKDRWEVGHVVRPAWTWPKR
jgi:predicted ATPase